MDHTASDPRNARDIEPREPGTFLRRSLFESRTVLLFGEVTSARAEALATERVALAAAGDEPIRMLIHSPGGHVESADTIHDLVRFIRPEVLMLGTGWVASAAALIYAAASKPQRLALPNTRFLLHQPLGGVQGPATDIEIESRQILAVCARLCGIFAQATGQSVETIARDTERNHWMTAVEARDYGLVDRIVQHVDDIG